MSTRFRLASFLLLALALGCTQEQGQPPKGSQKTKVKLDLANLVEVEPWKLWEEYGENELAADAAYKGKTLLIKGTAGKTERQADGRYNIGVWTYDINNIIFPPPGRRTRAEHKWFNDGLPPSVVGVIDPEFNLALSKIPTNSPVSIVGVCTGREAAEFHFKEYRVVLVSCRPAP